MRTSIKKDDYSIRMSGSFMIVSIKCPGCGRKFEIKETIDGEGNVSPSTGHDDCGWRDTIKLEDWDAVGPALI